MTNPYSQQGQYPGQPDPYGQFDPYAQPDPYSQTDPYGNPYQVTYQAAPMAMAPYSPYAMGAGPIGQVRSTGMCILLTIVTLGIYQYVWFYQVHQEMKDHSGEGLGGGFALLLAFFVGVAMWFVTPGEVGTLYRRRGWREPVSALNGCWILLPLIGPIIWFVQTNGAINDYWRSLGAVG